MGIYSYPQSRYLGSSYYYGYGRPIGFIPVFGFWPWYWYTDDQPGQSPSNDTRPGGNLTAQGIALPNNQSATYILYGDELSLSNIIGLVLNNTGAMNVSIPSDLSGNATLQDYRDQSFLLMKLNSTAPADLNSTFLGTLNDTIGDNLIVATATSAAGLGMVLPSIYLMGTAALMTGLSIL